MNLINKQNMDPKLIEVLDYVVDDVLNLDFSNLKFLYNDSIYYQIFGEFSYYKLPILEKHRGDYPKSKMIHKKVNRFLQPNKKIDKHIDKKPKIWSMVLYISSDTFGTVHKSPYDRLECTLSINRYVLVVDHISNSLGSKSNQ